MQKMEVFTYHIPLIIVPGVEISAGSLGHGLPIAIGLAIAAKTKNQNWLTYCLVSDGEINEGSNWEEYY